MPLGRGKKSRVGWEGGPDEAGSEGRVGTSAGVPLALSGGSEQIRQPLIAFPPSPGPPRPAPTRTHRAQPGLARPGPTRPGPPECTLSPRRMLGRAWKCGQTSWSAVGQYKSHSIINAVPTRLRRDCSVSWENMDASKQDDGWKSREKRQHCLYPEGVRIEDVVTGIFRVAPACLQLTESNEAVQTHAQEQNKYSRKEELYARS